MKIDVAPFKVEEGEPLSLNERATSVEPLYQSKEDYQAALEAHTARLMALQERLYVAGVHALVVVLQGMDSSGKDGAIKHVMSGLNPLGCKAVAFKTPTVSEAKHDFLWRVQSALPERGEIAVFNRSHYEAVLIERVHPALLEREGVFVAPEHLEKFWEQRLHSIAEFEKHLIASGTAIVKIFLHISKEEQLKRLIARLDDPDKVWKASLSDAAEREYWKDYRRAYEAALAATSLKHAPWHVVPADDKKNARLIVSQLTIEALERLPLDPPPLSEARKREIAEIRAALAGR